jgi:hypothetical protein
MLNSATIDIDTAPLGGDESDEAAMDYEMRAQVRRGRSCGRV